MDRLFPTSRIPRSPQPTALPSGDPLTLQIDGQTLPALMRQDHLAGVLVLQNGRIRLERYGLGIGRGTRWTGFSLTKAITSTLVGVALQDGSIRSLDDTVPAYLPQMHGSAYDIVTVRQLLTMTSGVHWIEDYTAPDSDNVRLYNTPDFYDLSKLTTPSPNTFGPNTSSKNPTGSASDGGAGTESVVQYLRHLPRETPPGTRWHYNTGETDLTGALVRAATGRPLSAYLSQTVWRDAGMDSSATWIAENGRDYGGSGLSATLRDWGRFGEFIRKSRDSTLQNPPVDPAYLQQATSTQQPIGEPGRGYGYQWWTYADGSFAALGIFGQSILIDPRRNLVIVVLGAWPQASSPALISHRNAIWSTIRTTLDQELAPAPKLPHKSQRA